MSTRFSLLSRRFRAGLILTLCLAVVGCAVRHTKHIPVAQAPPPAKEATLAELADRINGQNAAIQTLTATVNLTPVAGSVYSGVIKEYHDVKGFILVERPEMIRMIGQAPIVRTNIFDMVSNGEEFQLYLPTKQKFIVGKTSIRQPTKNSLESVRPQHILDALLVPPIDPVSEKDFLQGDEEDGHRYYVINVVGSDGAQEQLMLKRRVWFDRSTLELVRLQLYGPQGVYLEDVHYADYNDFQGVHYPTDIRISRPVEDYKLSINIVKATFNQPIDPEKFVLRRPAGAELVELSEAQQAPEPAGRREDSRGQ